MLSQFSEVVKDNTDGVLKTSPYLSRNLLDGKLSLTYEFAKDVYIYSAPDTVPNTDNFVSGDLGAQKRFLAGSKIIVDIHNVPKFNL